MVSRRQFLATSGIIATTGLAGCTGSSTTEETHDKERGAIKSVTVRNSERGAVMTVTMSWDQQILYTGYVAEEVNITDKQGNLIDSKDLEEGEQRFVVPLQNGQSVGLPSKFKLYAITRVEESGDVIGEVVEVALSTNGNGLKATITDVAGWNQ